MLRLLIRLLIAWARRDGDAHGELLGRPAAPDAPDGHGRGVVEPDGGPNISGGGADAIGGVEADPAEILDIGLDPGVAGAIFMGLDAGPEIAADIARGDAETARGGDEDVTMVLADPHALRQGLRGGGGGVRRTEPV